MTQNNTTLVCPACGSREIRSSAETRSLAVPLGPTVEYQAAADLCLACQTEGDFGGANEDAISRAREESEKLGVAHLLEGLQTRGVALAYFERAFGLPARTLTRWKAGDCSSAALALVRVVATFPWILDVADNRYTPARANSAVVHAAAEALSHFVSGSLRTQTGVVAQFGAGVTVVGMTFGGGGLLSGNTAVFVGTLGPLSLGQIGFGVDLGRALVGAAGGEIVNVAPEQTWRAASFDADGPPESSPS